MRVLWAVVVGVIGCAVSYVVATKFAAIGQTILGPTAGSILGIIVALGGAAITAALVIGIARPRTKPR